MKRRDFVRASAVGGAAVLGASVWPRRANAVTFGQFPADKASSMLPENLRAESVLECFLLGGLTPWESYYCVPGRGQADETWAYTNYASLIKAAEGCGFGNVAGEPFTWFGQDSAGQEIFFGPYMRRLAARPDVLKRMRVVINRHDLVTHEAAIGFMATGRQPGNPAAAGLATHVNRYFTDRDVEASHVPPFSYAFPAPSGFTFSDDGRALAAQGLHPSQARPLVFRLDSAARLNQLLSRATVGTIPQRAQYDALLSVYFDQYAQRLRVGGSDVRAEKFSDLRRAFLKQSQPEVIQSLLSPSAFEPWNTPKSCEEVTSSGDGQLVFSAGSTQVTPPAAGNLTAMGLRLATHLLTHPTHPARHCAVVDGGLRQADGGGGYDTHSNGPWRQATNFNNLLQYLLTHINEPGESDSNKLDLDKTMIILSSEFGRTPGRQTPNSSGRNHWPHGFAQIYIGGPIRENQAGVYGHIDETGNATQFTTSAENRIAALLALGIYPFAGDAYATSDVQGESEEGAAVRSVTRRILGHDV